MKKAGNAIVKILTYLLSVLLVLGAVGALAFFVLRQQGLSFYAEYNGERYYSGFNEKGLRLYEGERNEFSVSPVVDDGVPLEFTVTVTANPEYNFDFSVYGENHAFYVDPEESDYSEQFGVNVTDNGFELGMPEQGSVSKIVAWKYGSLSGSLETETEFEDNPYFLLTVTSGENILTIPLWLGDRITGIQTDTDFGLVFGSQFPHLHPFLVSLRELAGQVGVWNHSPTQADDLVNVLVDLQFYYEGFSAEEKTHPYAVRGVTVMEYLFDSIGDDYLSEAESAYALVLLGDLGK